MKPITVMVTASGAPGTAALLRALRRNGERELRLIGTDMSERAVGRHFLRRVSRRSRRCRPGLSGRDAGGGPERRRRRDPATVVVRSRRSRRPCRPLSDAGARLAARGDSTFERQGGDVRAPAPARRAGAGVPAGQRRSRGRGRGPPARLPGTLRLLQAGVLLGLARLPDPRPDRRPRAPAAERAPRLGVDAARGGSRAACPTSAAPTCS